LRAPRTAAPHADHAAARVLRARVVVACALAGASLSLGSCGGDARRGASDAPSTLQASPSERPLDDFGRAVPIPAARAAAPARIVSLNPTTTELLFALGAGPRLVGRTRFDLWPDSARLVPDVGDGLRPNVERVLAARPALVVLYASADNRPAADRLALAGVPTIALKVDRIADFRRAALLIGAAVGDTARARAVVDSVDRALDGVRRIAASTPRRPRVFYALYDSPLYTIGGGSFIDELLTIAGGRNVYGDSPLPSPQVSLEDVMRRDPDVVLAARASVPRILASPAWRPLRAVREGRVFGVDDALVERPSVRLGEAARHLAHLLHPDVVP
jgi:ABC-type Fe3+-hydroxamate transport system substrate-binding protein